MLTVSRSHVLNLMLISRHMYRLDRLLLHHEQVVSNRSTALSTKSFIIRIHLAIHAVVLTLCEIQVISPLEINAVKQGNVKKLKATAARIEKTIDCSA